MLRYCRLLNFTVVPTTLGPVQHKAEGTTCDSARSKNKRDLQTIETFPREVIITRLSLGLFTLIQGQQSAPLCYLCYYTSFHLWVCECKTDSYHVVNTVDINCKCIHLICDIFIVIVHYFFLFLFFIYKYSVILFL